MVELSKEELQRRIEILKNQDFYKGSSYFPERGSKSIEERFEDCVEQIKKYGWPDFQYLVYGMDVKSSAEIDQYVNCMEFVYRRNYLNFERNHHNSTCILRNKLYFEIFAKSIGVKVPSNIALIEDGKIQLLLDHYRTISLAELIDICPDGFIKALDGENGEAVYHLEMKEGKLLLSGNEISANEFSNKFQKGCFLFQERIFQHDEMNRMYPLSINTLRIVTVRNLKSNTISVWPSIMRMGANGSHIDNACQGGIICYLDTESGQLGKYGYRYSQYGGRFEKHPTTGLKFDEFKVPNIKDAVNAAMYFHSKLKDIHSIGWDVVITPDGPAFIEGNDDWEIIQAQINGGVRDLFERDFF